MSTATVLATIPAETPGRRLQIVFMSRSDGQSVIGLREQDHAEGLGWFVQRSFELDPFQVRALREVLGMTDRVTSTSAVRPVILAFPESQPVCADQSSPAHVPQLG